MSIQDRVLFLFSIFVFFILSYAMGFFVNLTSTFAFDKLVVLGAAIIQTATLSSLWYWGVKRKRQLEDLKKCIEEEKENLKQFKGVYFTDQEFNLVRDYLKKSHEFVSKKVRDQHDILQNILNRRNENLENTSYGIHQNLDKLQQLTQRPAEHLKTGQEYIDHLQDIKLNLQRMSSQVNDADELLILMKMIALNAQMESQVETHSPEAFKYISQELNKVIGIFSSSLKSVDNGVHHVVGQVNDIIRSIPEADFVNEQEFATNDTGSVIAEIRNDFISLQKALLSFEQVTLLPEDTEAIEQIKNNIDVLEKASLNIKKFDDYFNGRIKRTDQEDSRGEFLPPQT